MRPDGGALMYLDEDAGSLESAGRLLTLAEDTDLVPAERFALLARTGRFVDEFFQLVGPELLAPAAVQRRSEVRRRVHGLAVRQGAALEQLGGARADAAVEICGWNHLGDVDRRALTAAFRDRLQPVLVPLLPDAGRRLAPPANLSVNVAALLAGPGSVRRIGTVEVPPVVARFLGLPSGGGRPGQRVVPVEQVVVAHLAELFPGYDVVGSAVFRVTRQAGVVIPPDTDDMLTSVERQLRLGRHGIAVRAEVESGAPGELLDRLASDFGLSGEDVYRVDGLLGMADVADLVADVGSGAAPAVPPPGRRRSTRTPDLFRRLDEAEALVHFPYDSYGDSVVALLDQASADSSLLAIKQTLYRASPDGPTVRALVRAAERGAQVVAVVELGARLAERDSVACARALERAGCHVVYGLVGLRTHCFLTLVIRRIGAHVARYGAVGTGLHHPARRPEGLSLLSADPEITADLTDLFNYLTGYSRPGRFRKLLVGPGHLRSRLLELIGRETAAGPSGRIGLKVYRLVDREVIDALYRASERGVEVDLVVGGACALRPGVPGLSDGIRVVAPLGRHLETSRLFVFGRGETSAWFVSSGDLALANLGRQVDVAAPVMDPGHQARLEATFEVLVRLPAWEMDADGSWQRREAGAEDALRQLATSGTAASAGAMFR